MVLRFSFSIFVVTFAEVLLLLLFESYTNDRRDHERFQIRSRHHPLVVDVEHYYDVVVASFSSFVVDDDDVVVVEIRKKDFVHDTNDRPYLVRVEIHLHYPMIRIRRPNPTSSFVFVVAADVVSLLPFLFHVVDVPTWLLAIVVDDDVLFLWLLQFLVVVANPIAADAFVVVVLSGIELSIEGTGLR